MPWVSRKQDCVTLRIEAEYVATTDGVKETLYGSVGVSDAQNRSSIEHIQI